MGAVIERTFSTPGLGSGRPDYMTEISDGQLRAGMRLDANQSLKIFLLLLTNQWAGNPFAFARPPLAIGATEHIIDAETGLPLPWTMPVGHAMEVRMDWHSFDQPMDGRVYLDTFHYASALAESLTVYYENSIFTFDSRYIDPLGTFPHQWDITATNFGVAPAQGELIQFVVVTTLASPPLKGPEKTVRCKWCGRDQVVPKAQTRITCEGCGELFIVYNLP